MHVAAEVALLLRRAVGASASHAHVALSPILSFWPFLALLVTRLRWRWPSPADQSALIRRPPFARRRRRRKTAAAAAALAEEEEGSQSSWCGPSGPPNQACLLPASPRVDHGMGRAGAQGQRGGAGRRRDARLHGELRRGRVGLEARRLPRALCGAPPSSALTLERGA